MCRPLSLIQCISIIEVESNVLVYKSIYLHHVLLYKNENDSVMYGIIDKHQKFSMLVKINDLNFMTLHLKLFTLPFSFV